MLCRLMITTLILSGCTRAGFGPHRTDDASVLRDLVGGGERGGDGVHDGRQDGGRDQRLDRADGAGHDAPVLAEAGGGDLPKGHRQLTSTVGAPEPRRMHTYVWTGNTGVAATSNRLIVWGGEGAGGRLSNGGIYDPATDSWRSISTLGAPEARSWHRHDPIWTGATGDSATSHRLIVWAGSSSTGGTLQSGGIYDPATDSWKATTLQGAPGSISNHSSVWTGATGNLATAQRMIVWGGGTAGSTNAGGVYDPATDSWSATALTGAPAHRAYHSAVWTGDTGSSSTSHRMIIWGGLLGALGGYNATATGAIYDPATNTWTSTSTVGAPSARRWHTAVWTGNTAAPATRFKMIVWGGQLATQAGTSDGGVYDPATDSWTSIATGPAARWDHRAFWTGSSMLIWKGAPGSDAALYTPPGLWIAVPTTGTTSIYRYHGVVSTGVSFIEWGGEAPGNPWSNLGAVFVL